jgi:hypothetical protein
MMPRGRPKGSKNKTKIEFTQDWELGEYKPVPPKKVLTGKVSLNPAEVPPSSKSLDIHAIIRLCSKNNVSHLKMGDFFVSFHGPEAPGIGQMSKANGMKPSAKVEDLLPEVMALKEEFDTRQLMIDDPVAFEQQQIDMDMERGRHFDENNSRFK